MRYQDVIERMPNAFIIYENVTKEELSLITISKYEFEEEPNSGIFYVGTNSEVEELIHKKMQPSVSMNFN